MEQLDALAASTVSSTPAATCLSAEDRVRFGLDSTLNSTSRSAKAQPATRSDPRRSSGSTAAPSPARVGYPGSAPVPSTDPHGLAGEMDAATADLIRKLEACGEVE